MKATVIRKGEGIPDLKLEVETKDSLPEPAQARDALYSVLGSPFTDPMLLGCEERSDSREYSFVVAGRGDQHWSVRFEDES